MSDQITAPRPGSVTMYPDWRCPHLGGVCRVHVERDELRAEVERLQVAIGKERDQVVKAESALAASDAKKEGA